MAIVVVERQVTLRADNLVLSACLLEHIVELLEATHIIDEKLALFLGPRQSRLALSLLQGTVGVGHFDDLAILISVLVDSFTSWRQLNWIHGLVWREAELFNFLFILSNLWERLHKSSVLHFFIRLLRQNAYLELKWRLGVVAVSLLKHNTLHSPY